MKYDNAELSKDAFISTLEDIIKMEEKKIMERLDFLKNFKQVFGKYSLVKLTIIFKKNIGNNTNVELIIYSTSWVLTLTGYGGDRTTHRFSWQEVSERMNIENHILILLIKNLQNKTYESIKPEINIQNLL